MVDQSLKQTLSVYQMTCSMQAAAGTASDLILTVGMGLCEPAAAAAALDVVSARAASLARVLRGQATAA